MADDQQTGRTIAPESLISEANLFVHVLLNKPVDRAELFKHCDRPSRVVGVNVNSNQFAVADDQNAVADSGGVEPLRLSFGVKLTALHCEVDAMRIGLLERLVLDPFANWAPMRKI